jgi:Spy/CpxP family protein refolding chaperone
MIGCIALGLAAGLVAFKLHRRHRRCGGRHGGWRRHRHYFHVMDILGTTPGQEKVIREEVERMRERARLARDEAAAARGDVAEVIRGETFDRARFDAALGRIDAAWAQLKTAGAESAARIHETLDARQRERLAEILASRRGSRGPSFGPFR